MTPTFQLRFLLVLVVVIGFGDALAQESPTTRSEMWLELREAKAKELSPPERTSLEKLLLRLNLEQYMREVNTGFYGLTTVFGGMESGSGFTLGALYQKNEFANRRFDFQATARLSTKLYQQYGVRLAAPRLADERFFFDVTAILKDYREDSFFGIGADTVEGNETNFRDESFDVSGMFGVRPTPWARVGLRAGYLDTKVGSGRNPDLPSIEDVFDPSEVPGLDRQPSYQYLAFIGHVHYIDAPNPRAGGEYFFRLFEYHDRRFDAFGFRRYEVELYQYIPFFNKRRVFALRGFVSLSDPREGQEVPFNMMKTIGGSQTVRGFTEYRFRDRNFLLFNIEYRWEVFSGLDMTLFADAGRVYSEIEAVRIDNLEAAYGIGFRFNTAAGVFLRLDVGFGREGSRFFFKFGHVF